MPVLQLRILILVALLEKLKRVREKAQNKPNTTERIFCLQHVVQNVRIFLHFLSEIE